MRYVAPSSLTQALTLLAEGNAQPLVGGTDLLAGWRHGAPKPAQIIDIKRINDLPKPLEIHPGGVRIGATATLDLVSKNSYLRTHYSALAEAAGNVGSGQIRNRGTLVGNICHGSPAADTAPALLIFDTKVRIESQAGSREVRLADFFLGPGKTQCARDELVTSLWLPTPTPGSGSSTQRLARRQGVDLATVSCAALVGANGQAWLGLGAIAPTPKLVKVPKPIDLNDPACFIQARQVAVQAACPITDLRGSKEYRLAMVAVLAERVLSIAARRAKERS